MALASVAIEGFRSIKQIWLPLRRLTVLLGANGVGKTNLYRSLELLSGTANGALVPSLARSLAEQLNVFRVMHHGTGRRPVTQPRHTRSGEQSQ